jgi:hypothetical protein
MPNFGYHLARLNGRLRRRIYRARLPRIVRHPVRSTRGVMFDVFSYSGESTLPEQVASIRSFLRHVGRPKRFTVVSDGSHTDRSVRLLKEVDASVQVRLPRQAIPNAFPEKLRSYLATHPTGKQLALIMSLPEDGPCLYVDSDVLFFDNGADLIAKAADRNSPAYYLLDCQFSGDPRLLRDPTERNEPINTGVLLLFKQLDWSISIRRFLELEGEPNFFTNQTMTHLALHANGAVCFDPAKYVLQLDDQFVYADRYASASLALRHYVNPVRHKFWTSLKLEQHHA